MNYALPVTWFTAAFSAMVLFPGFYVFFKDTKNNVNRLFLIICAVSSFMLFLLAFYDFIESEITLKYVYRLILFLSYAFLPLNIHFYVELSKSRKTNFLKIPALYGVFIVMFALSLIFDFPFAGFKRVDGKFWKFIPAENQAFYFYIIFISAALVCCLLMLAGWKKASSSVRIKKQASVLMASLVLFLVIGSGLPQLLKPDRGNELFPAVLILSVVIYLLAIFYALIKYKFLSVDHRTMLDEVLANIDEYVFLLNTKMEILQTTDRVKNIIINKKQFGNILYSDIISEKKEFSIIFNDLLQKKYRKTTIPLSYRTGNNSLKTVSYFSVIEDRYHDAEAILVISKEKMSIEKFKNDFNITKREFEVINCAKAGLSAKETAKELQISARTVETHYINLYSKLNVKNKIELINLTDKYL